MNWSGLLFLFQFLDLLLLVLNLLHQALLLPFVVAELIIWHAAVEQLSEKVDLLVQRIQFVVEVGVLLPGSSHLQCGLNVFRKSLELF